MLTLNKFIEKLIDNSKTVRLLKEENYELTCELKNKELKHAAEMGKLKLEAAESAIFIKLVLDYGSKFSIFNRGDKITAHKVFDNMVDLIARQIFKIKNLRERQCNTLQILSSVKAFSLKKGRITKKELLKILFEQK